MEYDLPHEETVKCVLVGDTAVGKTRLICARVYNKQVSLSELVTMHVPTVWAVDTYRIHKEVLERSWTQVDGVNVSLRLWDTFGDHDKYRKYAYLKSDVVLICFSVGNQKSLRNCRQIWYPEIRRFCPDTPVLLVGCKNDLRYMCQDETYINYCKDRSPFVRATRESDLVLPEHGRAVARELGVDYFETSVLTYYGVDQMFENAIRAALIARRKKFWMTNLKRVNRPMLQAPFCPPKPTPPDIFVTPSTFEESMASLLANQWHTDIIFLVGSVGFSAHKAVLASASDLLFQLLTMPIVDDSCGHCSSNDSLAAGMDEVGSEADTECLLSSCALKLITGRTREVDGPLDPVRGGWRPPTLNQVGQSRQLNHPAFQSISIQQCEGLDQSGQPSLSVQTIISVSKLVSPAVLRQALHFLYTGRLEDNANCNVRELLEASEYLGFPQFQAYLTNIVRKEEYRNKEITANYIQSLKTRLLEVCLEEGLFSDVLFQLDDGTAAAHRPLLMARSDVMEVMFAGNFRESKAKMVSLRDVTESTFRVLLHFMYSDTVPAIRPQDCLPLLQLGNRLCLQRLLSLVERATAEQLQDAAADGQDCVELVLSLLEPGQLHNADQLADWCLHYLATNYDTMCKRYPKQVRALHPENQAYLNKHRWPPTWYLKDYDCYERMVRERQREENPIKPFKRTRTISGCLCFSGKRRQQPAEAAHSV
ncbi:Rho-related BTB domain-containing protein 2 [Amphibalanus amphitrite]|uniref:Rho-related BTB domain-containing protein 2 n=1 Tax=Amphibalanus amphitrite TaxID=1232801 RepID=A0A6A4X548_AMPAM|nr:rho-related BTB domain-containing protein 1-like isoform X2 [Amphibalanus amphitrite]KAF0312619.1 Rho-related BTB domain-containing protein 2 [Amphibalanus amphitrite]